MFSPEVPSQHLSFNLGAFLMGKRIEVEGIQDPESATRHILTVTACWEPLAVSCFRVVDRSPLVGTTRAQYTAEAYLRVTCPRCRIILDELMMLGLVMKALRPYNFASR